MVKRVGFHDIDHRTEDFLLGDTHGRISIGKDGGLIEKAAAHLVLQFAAAGQNRGAFVFADFNIAVDAIHDRDPARAFDLMKTHIETVQKHLLSEP